MEMHRKQAINAAEKNKTKHDNLRAGRRRGHWLEVACRLKRNKSKITANTGRVGVSVGRRSEGET